jgi:selenocysteine-specific elongation factor
VEKVSPDLFVHSESLNRLETWIRRTLSTRPSLAVGDLRETWGMSRKYSVPILELFDKKGVTRRIGDVRGAGRALDEPESD